MVDGPPEKTPAASAGTQQLARSAGKLAKSAENQEDSADRRTELAADRTVLAAERTYAAWVRTGLSALASGVGAGALLDKILPALVGKLTGTLLIAFSAFCFGAAVWRQMVRIAPPRPDTQRLPQALLIAVNGFLALVSLGALVGIWLA